MALREKLHHELTAAMKARDEFSVGVLRLILAALHNKEIEVKAKGGEGKLDDEAVLQVLRSEAKKRKEAVDIFIEGGREDLAEKEKRELVYISNYLPQELDRGAIEKVVKDIISQTGLKEFGPAMKEIMKEMKGKADARLVSDILKKELGQ